MIRGISPSLKMGWYDYNDTATSITPISVTGGSPYYILTNNGLGALTQIKYGVGGVSNIWDSQANRFNWNGLAMGDTVDLRCDLSVTTSSPNTEVSVVFTPAYGTASQYDLNVETNIYKAVSTYQIVPFYSIYMGNVETLNNPAVFRIRSDNNCTVKVNGWYIRVIKR